MNLDLALIDSSAPFFVKAPGKSLNWSKAPIGLLEKNQEFRKKTHKKIRENFDSYVKKVSTLGYNAISIDELSFLTDFPFYPENLRSKIQSYQKSYRKLFKTAKKNGMKVFLTSDFLFSNASIEQETGGSFDKVVSLFYSALEKLFSEFENIDGIILRIGESDGVDVKGDFRSRLFLKTPEDANRLLKEILPLFKKHSKTLIFRTWTIGAYPIGDLIWNKITYEKVFLDIPTDNLIISMKYGEGDFFRYLNLNSLFFQDDRPKLVEFQARREYEGFGEFPSFVGWQYAAYREELKNAKNLAGFSVWCQTGGWSSFKNITFLKNTSYWNELNTFVCIGLFRKNWSVKKSLRKFYGKKNLTELIRFLRLSEYVILNLLYDPEFAIHQLYIHRVRIPPLLHITWDRVTISDHFRILYYSFCENRERSVEVGYKAIESLNEMGRIAKRISLPYDFRFQYDTFQLFAFCRELLYLPDPERQHYLLEETIHLANIYAENYPDAYKFRILSRKRIPGFMSKLLLKLFIRRNKDMRILDRILFSPLMRHFYLFLYQRIRSKLPSFINQQAMPVSELLK
ncbi:glycosyl hydrolase family 67 [Leptospira stimsonii]|uniref:Glycosyl hydrolase family 67 n=1 Tax=Leptospira stimsonii TaxID=2202203 RepID=A0ABY2MYF9_9LEPT|nr:glycosyl hydrolase family 67 [Leptospira stimsonii]TGK14424.1 glycosyl hydrolase family 67 [Leptospira stimsonii]TGM11787.1 glycosyl hydrolase family 67 [Leptospira stimsonii]